MSYWETLGGPVAPPPPPRRGGGEWLGVAVILGVTIAMVLAVIFIH